MWLKGCEGHEGVSKFRNGDSMQDASPTVSAACVFVFDGASEAFKRNFSRIWDAYLVRFLKLAAPSRCNLISADSVDVKVARQFIPEWRSL